jgi:hypothetical protein
MFKYGKSTAPEKKFLSYPLIAATNITKLKIILFLTGVEKNLGQFTKNYRTFEPKHCH